MHAILDSLYGASLIVFISSTLIHLFLILRYSEKLRNQSGNHIQIVLKVFKQGGGFGWAFALSFAGILLCSFFLWLTALLTKL